MLVHQHRRPVHANPANGLELADEVDVGIVEHVDLARLQLHEQRVLGGNELEDDLIEIGTFAVVVGVGDQRKCDPAAQLSNLNGPDPTGAWWNFAEWKRFPRRSRSRCSGSTDSS